VYQIPLILDQATECVGGLAVNAGGATISGGATIATGGLFSIFWWRNNIKYRSTITTGKRSCI
jgi:hypothetical protein